MAKRVMTLTQVGQERQVKARAGRTRHLTEFERDLERYHGDGDIRSLQTARKQVYRSGGSGMDDLTARIRARIAVLTGRPQTV